MIEFYLPIKYVHISAVLISGGLFFVRGLLLLNGQTWAMAAPLRYLSYSIDTVLLTAALMLVTLLPSIVFKNGWLVVKLSILVLYVVLGSVALKRGRNLRTRWVCFFSAAMSYIFILSIAYTHQPWGWFSAF